MARAGWNTKAMSMPREAIEAINWLQLKKTGQTWPNSLSPEPKFKIKSLETYFTTNSDKHQFPRKRAL